MIKNEILTTKKNDAKGLKKVFDKAIKDKNAVLYKFKCECGNNKFILICGSDYESRKSKENYKFPYHCSAICSKCGLMKEEI